MIPQTKITKPWALTLTGLMITLGSGMLIFWPWFTSTAWDMVLSLYSAPTIQLWTKNPVPLYLEFYMFNWTNPHDIYNASTKPHFDEIGPFVFEETKEKVNITWHSNNTISFDQIHTYHFREEMSVAPLTTKITTLNSIAATAAYILREWNFVMRKGFDWSIRSMSHEIYTEKTVGQFLFDGYEDTLIKVARSVPNFHGISFPDWDKFAWFYKRNGSAENDGHFNVVASGENFGQMKNWNYKDHTGLYDGACDKVQGSSGEFYGPNRKRDRVGIFANDICRFIPLDYVRDVDFDGTLGYRYELGDSFFSADGPNKCYCPNNLPNLCPPYGSVNVSLCKFGAPGFVSRPHFYGADPYYLESIDGMQPDEKKHQMSITLEPTSGLPLSVEARLQLNVLIEPLDYITMFQELPRKFYMPILWVQETADLPPNLHFFMKMFLKIPLITKCLGGMLLLCGIPLFTVLLYKPILTRLRWRSTSRKNIRMTFNDRTDFGLPLVNSNKILIDKENELVK